MAGPQSYVLDMMKSVDLKTEMLLVLPKEDNAEFRYRLDEASMNYLEVSMRRPQRSLRGLISFIINLPFDIFKLVAIIKKQSDCIVYCAGVMANKGILAAKIARVPSVWQMNDTHAPKLVSHIYRLMCGLPTGYVYVSHATKNYYENLCQPVATKYIIPSPINIEKFKSTSKLSKERAIKVGTVCSVNPVKNLEYFIEISAELDRITPALNFEFEVIGPIPKTQEKYYKKLLNKMREENLGCLKFIGAQRDIPRKLAELDIYICTSYNEASPIAVWEAMAAGLKILSTNVGDVAVHLRNSGSGMIIPFGDPKKAAELLLKLYDNRSNYTNKRNQLQYVAEHFCAKKCADMHEELFNDIK